MMHISLCLSRVFLSPTRPPSITLIISSSATSSPPPTRPALLLPGLQWTACGQSGVSGRPVGWSAPTGGGGSAARRRPRTAGGTARAPTCSPRTAPTGCACRVSTATTTATITTNSVIALLILCPSHPRDIPPIAASPCLTSPHHILFALFRLHSCIKQRKGEIIHQLLAVTLFFYMHKSCKLPGEMSYEEQGAGFTTATWWCWRGHQLQGKAS